jgi:predicted nucleic acid-binding protein
MTPKQIFWDSCVFVTLLSKHKEQKWLDNQEVCKNCLQEAIDGKVEIFISTLTIVEVNRTKESSFPIPKEVQDKITKLIDQPFIKVVPADLARAKEARLFIWDYSWLKPVDAMHLASALYAKVTELFTYDGGGSQKGLLDLDGLVGTPLLKIKQPHFEGTQIKFAESPSTK